MLIFIFAIITIIYNYIIINKHGIPESLSETAYINNKLLFTAYCFSTILLMPEMFAITPDNLQFLVFLMFGGILISGFSPTFKDYLASKVHYISAAISFMVFVIYMVLLMNPWITIGYIILLSLLIMYKKNSYIYFAEMLSLLAILLHLIIN